MEDFAEVSVLGHDDVVSNLLAPCGRQDAERALYIMVGREFHSYEAVLHTLVWQITAARMVASADASVDGLKGFRAAFPQWCSRPDPGLV